MSLYKQIGLARELHAKLLDILENDLGVEAFVSFSICRDIVEHHLRDMDRLYAVHQKYVQSSKHIAYLAFWIRKLKPISQAFKIVDIEDAGGREKLITARPIVEIDDINERCSIYYAIVLLNAYITDGHITVPSHCDTDTYKSKLAGVTQGYFTGVDSSGMNLGNRYEAVVYDMRYRTFGPHHLVHIVNHLLAEAAHP